MKSTRRFMICLTLLFAMGCASTRGTECAWVKIITVSNDDKLTNETAAEILAHNRKVETVCAP